MNAIAPSTPPQRLFFLDWLRIAAFGLLVPYHVGMLYVRWGFHVKSATLVPALEPWMLLSGPWRMSLLFIVSGAATAAMLRQGASVAWLRRRSRRLLLPLLCGMVLVVPPQAYFEVVQKFGHAGSYLDFLALYFTGYSGFCEGTHCLLLPTWNHLWFLPYLWLYTTLLCGLLALRPQALDVLACWAGRALGGLRLLLIPIAALLLLRLALAARFPSTHALFGDWFNHAMYFGMFMAGAVFARWPGVWQRLVGWRWLAMGAAIAAWALVVGPADVTGGTLRHAAISVLQWGALVAALGFAARHLNHDHRWRARLTEAVFPVYIVHQTLIIALSQWLAPLHWRPAVEGPVLVIATFLLSATAYTLVRRVRLLRPWFGLTENSAPARRRPIGVLA